MTWYLLPPDLRQRHFADLRQREAEALREWALNTLSREFCCPYCGSTHRSPTNLVTGSDISCCGEVGHCEPIDPLDD